jgi:hypothetical protein
LKSRHVRHKPHHYEIVAVACGNPFRKMSEFEMFMETSEICGILKRQFAKSTKKIEQ